MLEMCHWFVARALRRLDLIFSLHHLSLSPLAKSQGGLSRRAEQGFRAPGVYGGADRGGAASRLRASALGQARQRRPVSRHHGCRPRPRGRPAVRLEFSLSRARTEFSARQSIEFVSGNNPLGLDPNDPAGQDDIVKQNELHLVVNKPTVIEITSKDVIHGFVAPAHAHEPGCDSRFENPDVVPADPRRANMRSSARSFAAPAISDARDDDRREPGRIRRLDQGAERASASQERLRPRQDCPLLPLAASPRPPPRRRRNSARAVPLRMLTAGGLGGIQSASHRS